MAVAGELVAESWQHVDDPDTGLGLGVADGDAAVGQVDIAPSEGGRLADAEAGVNERRDQRMSSLARSVRLERGPPVAFQMTARAPGEVRLEAWLDGEFLTVVVADDGVGMSSGRGSHGLGQGLAITRRLAEVPRDVVSG